jgi:hypothetical protein
MFGVKNKAMASTLSLPLPLVTILFNVYCSLRFYPVFGDISVEVITVLKLFLKSN